MYICMSQAQGVPLILSFLSDWTACSGHLLSLETLKNSHHMHWLHHSYAPALLPVFTLHFGLHPTQSLAALDVPVFQLSC